MRIKRLLSIFLFIFVLSITTDVFADKISYYYGKTKLSGIFPHQYTPGEEVELPTGYKVSSVDGDHWGLTIEHFYDNANLEGEPITHISASDSGDKTFYVTGSFSMYYVYIYKYNYGSNDFSVISERAGSEYNLGVNNYNRNDDMLGLVFFYNYFNDHTDRVRRHYTPNGWDVYDRAYHRLIGHYDDNETITLPDYAIEIYPSYTEELISPEFEYVEGSYGWNVVNYSSPEIINEYYGNTSIIVQPLYKINQKCRVYIEGQTDYPIEVPCGSSITLPTNDTPTQKFYTQHEFVYVDSFERVKGEKYLGQEIIANGWRYSGDHFDDGATFVVLEDSMYIYKDSTTVYYPRYDAPEVNDPQFDKWAITQLNTEYDYSAYNSLNATTTTIYSAYNTPKYNIFYKTETGANATTAWLGYYDGQKYTPYIGCTIAGSNCTSGSNGKSVYYSGRTTILPNMFVNEGSSSYGQYIELYDNPEFEGQPITEIGPNETGDKVFYVKYTSNWFNSFDPNKVLCLRYHYQTFDSWPIGESEPASSQKCYLKDENGEVKTNVDKEKPNAWPAGATYKYVHFYQDGELVDEGLMLVTLDDPNFVTTYSWHDDQGNRYYPARNNNSAPGEKIYTFTETTDLYLDAVEYENFVPVSTWYELNGENAYGFGLVKTPRCTAPEGQLCYWSDEPNGEPLFEQGYKYPNRYRENPNIVPDESNILEYMTLKFREENQLRDFNFYAVTYTPQEYTITMPYENDVAYEGIPYTPRDHNIPKESEEIGALYIDSNAARYFNIPEGTPIVHGDYKFSVMRDFTPNGWVIEETGEKVSLDYPMYVTDDITLVPDYVSTIRGAVVPDLKQFENVIIDFKIYTANNQGVYTGNLDYNGFAYYGREGYVQVDTPKIKVKYNYGLEDDPHYIEYLTSEYELVPLAELYKIGDIYDNYNLTEFEIYRDGELLATESSDLYDDEDDWDYESQYSINYDIMEDKEIVVNAKYNTESSKPRITDTTHEFFNYIEYDELSDDIVIPNPEKEGYTFDGWLMKYNCAPNGGYCTYTVPSLQKDLVIEKGSARIFRWIELTPQFSIKQVTVTKYTTDLNTPSSIEVFDYGTEYNVGVNNYSNSSVENDAEVTFIHYDSTVETGYVEIHQAPNGWSVENRHYDDNDTITLIRDITLIPNTINVRVSPEFPTTLDENGWYTAAGERLTGYTGIEDITLYERTANETYEIIFGVETDGPVGATNPDFSTLTYSRNDLHYGDIFQVPSLDMYTNDEFCFAGCHDSKYNSWWLSNFFSDEGWQPKLYLHYMDDNDTVIDKTDALYLQTKKKKLRVYYNEYDSSKHIINTVDQYLDYGGTYEFNFTRNLYDTGLVSNTGTYDYKRVNIHRVGDPMGVVVYIPESSNPDYEYSDIEIPEGYEFDGWYTEPNGQGEKYSYEAFKYKYLNKSIVEDIFYSTVDELEDNIVRRYDTTNFTGFEPIHLYANYVKKQVTVTNYLSGDESPIIEIYNYGDTYTFGSNNYEPITFQHATVTFSFADGHTVESYVTSNIYGNGWEASIGNSSEKQKFADSETITLTDDMSIIWNYESTALISPEFPTLQSGHAWFDSNGTKYTSYIGSNNITLYEQTDSTPYKIIFGIDTNLENEYQVDMENAVFSKGNLHINDEFQTPAYSDFKDGVCYYNCYDYKQNRISVDGHYSNNEWAPTVTFHFAGNDYPNGLSSSRTSSEYLYFVYNKTGYTIIVNNNQYDLDLGTTYNFIYGADIYETPNKISNILDYENINMHAHKELLGLDINLDAVNPDIPEGYKFDGWYTEPTGGVKITEENSLNYFTTLQDAEDLATVTRTSPDYQYGNDLWVDPPYQITDYVGFEPIHLYAHYVEDQTITHTVTYPNGDVYEVEEGKTHTLLANNEAKANENVATVTFKYANYRLPDATRYVQKSYTPNGWLIGNDNYAVGTDIVVNEDIVLVPDFVETTIGATFPEVVDNDYFRSEWRTASYCGGGSLATTYNGTTNKTYYESYKRVLHYDEDNGTPIYTNAFCENYDGMCSDALGYAEKDGYYFDGWALTIDGQDYGYYSASEFEANGGPGSELQFSAYEIYNTEGYALVTADYSLANYYISYNLNGGRATGNPSLYTVEDEFTLNNPTKDGYEFTGWSGTGLTGNNNMIVTVPAGSSGERQYTAHFKKIVTVTEPDGTTNNYYEGDSYTFGTNDVTKTAENIATVTFNPSNGDENITRYVQKQYIPNGFKVGTTHYNNQQTITLTNNIVIERDYTETIVGVEFPTDPTRIAFTFDGWYNGDQKFTSYSDTSDITLTANWIYNNTPLDDIVCQRATKLHTIDGVTYGQIVTSGELHPGDAFDCDVNGDGVYDPDYERFYYVSERFNASNGQFESDTAVLIYSYNTQNGNRTTNSNYTLYASNTNENGPTTAALHMPTMAQWPNVSLKETNRQLSFSDGSIDGSNAAGGYTLPKYNYSMFSARMLSLSEYKRAVNNSNDIEYYKEHGLNWLFENPQRSSSLVFSMREGGSGGTSITDNYGVRPAIEVPVTKINNVFVYYIVTLPDRVEEVLANTDYTIPNNDYDKQADTLSTVTFVYGNGNANTTSDVLKQYTNNGFTINGTHYNAGDKYTVTSDIELIPDYIETTISARFPAEPTKANYKFVGWYTDPTNGTEYTSYSGTSNITLYAHWIPLETITLGTNDLAKQPEVLATVTFNPHNGQPITTSDVVKTYEPNGWRVGNKHYLDGETIYVPEGTVVERNYVEKVEPATYPENPTKNGYEFIGWYDDEIEGNLVSVYGGTENITLHARYSNNYANLTENFDFNQKLLGLVTSNSKNFRKATLDEYNNVKDDLSNSNDITGPESPNKVYMWADGQNILYYSDADVIYFPEDSSYYFSYVKYLKNIDLSGLNTSKVTNMDHMFANEEYGNDYVLSSLNLSNFDTRNVTNMAYMFHAQKCLILDVSSFDTHNVTNMSGMFYWASNSDTILDLSNFDTSNVTNMSYMFGKFKGQVIGIETFDTHNVTTMYNMLSNTTFKTLDLSGWDVSNVTDMSNMFDRAAFLVDLDVSTWDVSNVERMSQTFYYTWRLTELDLRSWDTSNVVYTNEMFARSENLRTIYVSDKWDMSSVRYGNFMFDRTTSIVGQNGTTYDETNIDYDYAHIDNAPTDPGYLSERFLVTPKYTITFDGGDLYPTFSRLNDAGSPIGNLPEYSYIYNNLGEIQFEGWYTDTTYTTRVTPETIPTGNVTYYAKSICTLGDSSAVAPAKPDDIAGIVTFEPHNGQPATTSYIYRSYYAVNKWIVNGVVMREGTVITLHPDDVFEYYYESEIESVNFPSNPSKPRYNFMGWYTEEEGGERVTSYQQEQSITLHAQWEEKNINICTYSDGTEEECEPGKNYRVPYSKKVEHGTVNEIINGEGIYENEVYRSFELSSWYSVISYEIDGVTYAAGESYQITGDTYITVNLDTSSEPSVYFDEDIEVEPEWFSDGEHYFFGWYTEPVDGERITSYVGTEPINVYAHYYTDADAIVNLEYEGLSDSYRIKVNKGTELPLEDDMSENYMPFFLDYQDGRDIESKYVREYMTAIGYLVNGEMYNIGDVITINEDTVVYALPSEYHREISDIETPYKEGYIFKGWYDEPEDGNYVDFNSSSFSPYNDTFYAQYVEYNPAEDVIVDFDGEISVYPRGTILDLPTEKDKESDYPSADFYNGIEFLGYVDIEINYTLNNFLVNGIEYAKGDQVTLNEDKTIRSNYDKEATYSSSTLDDFPGLEYPNFPDFDLDDTFTGWYSSLVGGTQYHNAEELPNGGTLLFARFASSDEYVLPVNDQAKANDVIATVTFDPNNGEATITSTVEKQYTPNGWKIGTTHYNDGETVTVTPETVIEPDYIETIVGATFPANPEKANYGFDGWYNNGTKYTSYSGTSDITLTARWSANLVPVCIGDNCTEVPYGTEINLGTNNKAKDADIISTVTFNLNNGEGTTTSNVTRQYTPNGWLINDVHYADNATITVTEEINAVEDYVDAVVGAEFPAEPTSGEHYTFLGWSVVQPLEIPNGNKGAYCSDGELCDTFITSYDYTEDLTIDATYSLTYTLVCDPENPQVDGTYLFDPRSWDTISFPNMNTQPCSKDGYEFYGFVGYQNDTEVYHLYAYDFDYQGNGYFGMMTDDFTIPVVVNPIFRILSYDITYNKDGGEFETDFYTDYYSVDYDDIEIPNLVKDGYTFLGWTGTGLTEVTKDVVIPSGSTGNREYNAVFAQNYTLRYPDGTEETIYEGEVITLPTNNEQKERELVGTVYFYDYYDFQPGNYGDYYYDEVYMEYTPNGWLIDGDHYDDNQVIVVDGDINLEYDYESSYSDVTFPSEKNLEHFEFLGWNNLPYGQGEEVDQDYINSEIEIYGYIDVYASRRGELVTVTTPDGSDSTTYRYGDEYEFEYYNYNDERLGAKMILKYNDGVTEDAIDNVIVLENAIGYTVNGVETSDSIVTLEGDTTFVFEPIYEESFGGLTSSVGYTTPTREHYTFLGWFTDDGRNYEDFGPDGWPLHDDLIFNAHWEGEAVPVCIGDDCTEVPYGTEINLGTNEKVKDNDIVATVTFDPNNGEATTTSTVERQYTPNGWLIGTTHYADNATITITEEINAVEDYTDVIIGAEFPEDPEKENYGFDGWFNNGTKYTSYNGTSDITLTAKWTGNLVPVCIGDDCTEVPYGTEINLGVNNKAKENDIVAIVTFDPDNGEATTTSTVERQYTPNGWIIGDDHYDDNATITITDEINAVEDYIDTIIGAEFPADPEKENYGFDGWFYDDTEYTSYEEEEDITLTAEWTGNPITVCIGDDCQDVPYGSEIDLGGNYKDKDNDVIAIVTFDPNNGEASTISTVERQYTPYGWLIDGVHYDDYEIITVTEPFNAVEDYTDEIIGAEFPADPERENYGFDGWYNNGTEYTSYEEEEDITLTAEWTGNPITVCIGDDCQDVPYGSEIDLGGNYKDKDNDVIAIVTFDPNNGEASTISTVERQYTPNGWLIDGVHYDDYETITVTEEINAVEDYTDEIIGAEFPSDPTKENYVFAGWFDSQAGGTEYTSYEDEEDITLYAQYSGEAITVCVDEVCEDVPYGTELNLGTNNNSKDNAELSMVEFNYHNGDSTTYSYVQKQFTPNGWLVNGTHYNNGAVITVQEFLSIEPDYIETIVGATFPENPTKENYEFQGWFDDEDADPKTATAYTSYTDPDNDISLHAIWVGEGIPVCVSGNCSDIPYGTEYNLGVNDTDKDPEQLAIVTFKYYDDVTEDQIDTVTKIYYPYGWLVNGVHYEDYEDIIITESVTIEPDYGYYIDGAIIPDHISKENYYFVGWYTEEVGGELIDSEEYIEDEDIVIHAHWIPVDKQVCIVGNCEDIPYGTELNLGTNNIDKDNTYGAVVVYDYHLDDGSDSPYDNVQKQYTPNGWLVNGVHYDNNEDITIEGDTNIVPDYLETTIPVIFPETVNREGYVFKGWYTEATGGTKMTSYDGDADITVHAQYDKVKIIVTNPDDTEDEYEYGDEYTFKTVPAKANTNEATVIFNPNNGEASITRYVQKQYTPVDWTLNGVHYNEGDKITLTENIKPTPQYTENVIGVEFPSDPEKEHHTFDGWFNNGIEYTSYNTLADIELTAEYTKDKVIVEEPEGEQEYEYGDEYIFKAVPTKANTNEATVIFNPNNGEASITRYVQKQYTPVDWTLNGVHYNEGDKITLTENIKPTPQYTENVIGVEFPSDPEKEHHTFDGWFNNGIEYTSYNTLADIELTAEYTKDKVIVEEPEGEQEYEYGDEYIFKAVPTKANTNEATVIFNPNNGEASITRYVQKQYTPVDWTLNGVHYNEGDKITLTENIKPTPQYTENVIGVEFPSDPEKEHHTFDGWFNNGIEYTSYNTLADIELTAEYTKDKVIVEEPDGEHEYEYGDEYTFKAVPTKANENIATVTFKPENGEDDIVRYVQTVFTPYGWTLNGTHYEEGDTITLTENIKPEPYYIEIVAGAEFPADPEREHYTFEGWFNNGTEYTSYVDAEDIILTAEWSNAGPTSITINSRNMVIVKGTTKEVDITTDPVNLNEYLTYTGYSNIITVTDAGVVEGIEVGETTITVSTTNDPSIEETINVKVIDNEITSDVYTVTTKDKTGEDIKIIIGSPEQVTVSDYIDNVNNDNKYLKVYNRDNELVTDLDELITTGYTIKLVIDDYEFDSVRVIIRGDVEPDGYIDVSDKLAIKRHILEMEVIDDYRLYAADLDEDPEATIDTMIDVSDNLKLTLYILEKIESLNEEVGD